MRFTSLTTNKISGLVLVNYLKLPTRLLQNVGSSLRASSNFDNFNQLSIGVFTGLQSSILNFFNNPFASLCRDRSVMAVTKEERDGTATSAHEKEGVVVGRLDKEGVSTEFVRWWFQVTERSLTTNINDYNQL